MQNRTIITINPTQLKPNHMPLLMDFFKSQREQNNSVFFSNQTYPISAQQGVPQYLKLTHTVIHRYKQTLPDGTIVSEHHSRYSILSQDSLAEGGFSKIYREEGTLTIKNASLLYKTGKKRIIKAQTGRFGYSHNTLFKGWKNEVAILHLLPEHHCKKMILSKNCLWSFIVMRQFEDRDLFSVLKEDFTKREPVSTENRLTLSIQLLRALQELHEQSIIHRDIKLENIIIDRDFHAHIVDFGLSRTIENDDKAHNIGSLLYVAPEVIPAMSNLYSSIDCTSDIFSLGLILRLLWGAIARNITLDDRTYTYPEYDSLFMHIKTELSSTQKAHIKHIISSMTAKTKTDRISLPEAIALFDALDLDFRLNKQKDISTHSVKFAHKLGLEGYEILKKLALTNQENTLEILEQTLHGLINRIQNRPEAIHEFIRIIDSHALRGIIDATHCRNTISSIIKQFTEHYQQLVLLHTRCENNIAFLRENKEEAATNAFQLLDEQILFVINKRHDRKITLDNIAELNQRFSDNIPLLCDSIHALSQQYASVLPAIKNNPLDEKPHCQQPLPQVGLTFFQPVKNQSHASMAQARSNKTFCQLL